MSIPNEGTIRLASFLGIFILMAIWEVASPKRPRAEPRLTRWFTNLGIVVLDTALLRVVFPVLAIGVAAWAQQKGWGLLNMSGLSVWQHILGGVILLDLAIYIQHVAAHKIPILWRVHKVHHADRDIDVSTALRFHPIEILLSMGYKIGIVIALGADPFAVFLFEVILNGSAMFNHSNINLPKRIDTVLRTLFVTPDMHRVHHSVIPKETDSNYGFCLSIWDRIFRTHTPQPIKGHDGMTIGLSEYQDKGPSNILWSLLLPFKSRPGPSS